MPEERAVFTGDTIFSECQTWLMTSNVDQWIEALERIRQLDVDHLIPGHGPVQTIDVPRHAAGRAARSGRRPSPTRWRRAGRARRPSRGSASTTRFGPVDVGQGYMMDHIQNNNAGSLWDKLTALGYAKGR